MILSGCLLLCWPMAPGKYMDHRYWDLLKQQPWLSGCCLMISLVRYNVSAMLAFTVFRYFCKIQMTDQIVCGSRPCPALVRRTEEGWNHTNKAHAKASSDIRVP
ncbi:unnamed protein product [Linum tenue]|uniref:Secreted protein n=1 Tax=Linum tenue TaxID=586396 RepID=A0AAV0S8D5_9ROSI|nr:unnamed protein product [Linum tenue]